MEKMYGIALGECLDMWQDEGERRDMLCCFINVF